MPLFLRRFDARNASPLGQAGPRRPTSGSCRSGRLHARMGACSIARPRRPTRSTRRRCAWFGVTRSAAPTAAVSADGATLAIGGREGRVRLLDLASGRVRTLSGRHNGTVQEVAFSPDGRALATAGDGWRRWSSGTRARAARPRRLAGHTRGARPGPQPRRAHPLHGEHRLDRDHLGRGRRPSPRAPVRSTGLARIPRYLPPAFAVSPDGRSARRGEARRSGGPDRRRDPAKEGSFEAFAGPTPALAIEYTPDGRRLAVAGGGGLVGLWDARSGQRVGPLLHAPSRGCAERPAIVACSSDGPGARRRPGRPARRGRRRRGGAHLGPGQPQADRLATAPAPLVLGMAFSPDGSQLAIATGWVRAEPDGVEVRDPRSGERLARLPPTTRSARSRSPPMAACSPAARSTAWRCSGRPTAGGRSGGARPRRGARSRGGLLPGRPHAGHLARRRHGRALGRRVPAADRPPLPGPPGRWVTARFTPDGSACSSSTTTGARSAGRSTRRSGGSTPAPSPAAASRPSSGRRSCPSRTTSRFAPPLGLVEAAAAGQISPSLRTRAFAFHTTEQRRRPSLPFRAKQIPPARHSLSLQSGSYRLPDNPGLLNTPAGQSGTTGRGDATPVGT